jgi:hypothetical protein
VQASAPCVRPLTEPLPGVPALPRDGVQLFLVTREGAFAGRTFGAGEVLVCRGEARSTDLTVLVARGHGRPRLGWVQGTRLIGDAGEPCLPERWAAVGRLVACYRHASHGWVVELFDREGSQDLRGAPLRVEDRGAVGAADRLGGALGAADRGTPASASLQLSLFAA